MSYTSCVMDEAVPQHSKRMAVIVDFAAPERPVSIQMLGKEEERLVAASLRLMEGLHPDLFDLNLGCPAKHVTWRGRGAALLREPALIARLAGGLVRALPVPVTAKIRLGWDERSLNHLEVAHILEDCGIAAIAVHGRTKVQAYSGRADWQAIAEVKRAVRIPVLANGDVRTVADIAAIKQATGCDAILIGRGAIGNPWIFARRDVGDVPYAERLAMVRRHLTWMADYYGVRVGTVLFRKFAIHYINELPGAAALRPLLGTATTPEEMLAILESWSPGQ